MPLGDIVSNHFCLGNVSLTLNKQTSELEKTCNSLAEELQRKCMCPNCSQKNVEALRAILEANKNS